MKCFYHNKVDAVGSCKNCHRGLCAACAVEVTNGIACISRCEAEAMAIDEILQRSKTAYQKTSNAYAVNAIVYILMGLILIVVGFLMGRAGVFLHLLGGAFLIGAILTYLSARKFKKIGP